MSGGWSCSHQIGNLCDLLDKPCEPGIKGCTLYGKARFADPASPSNEALERRERMRREKEMEELMKRAKSGF
ncbi:hypothetical protein [Hydrogenimonas sp.]